LGLENAADIAFVPGDGFDVDQFARESHDVHAQRITYEMSRIRTGKLPLEILSWQRSLETKYQLP
jgi:hypothetical protein